MSNFSDVMRFHQKFGLPTVADGPPTEISAEARDFRIRFLMEEMCELAEAYGLTLEWEITSVSDNGMDLPAVADALVDLSYVVLGTAHMHRLPWEELFAEVQRANMTKMRATGDGSDSKRQSSLDVVKPEGWMPPDIGRVLRKAGKIQTKTKYDETGYGTWLFICPTCHIQWTREVRADDVGAPIEVCSFCKEAEVIASL